MCFPVEFAKFLRAPILENICKRLPLKPVQITLTRTAFFFWPLTLLAQIGTYALAFAS